ncbi:unnamed protein product, partial [Enterobius vermicularis]|uniref:WD_REPEATS_REGION domain-containing protein n=1 Tax=Enterobius vermicularis TaxID=51028 RepID=A0A158Q982_ENTVE
TSGGHIIVFDCSKPNTVTFKKVIAEHTGAVVDIAECEREKLCCSCDVSGNIVVWGKNLCSIEKKITTKLNYSCLSIYGRKVVVGTYTGKILIFCADLGNLLIDINAHIRQVNAVVVSNDCSKMLSVSEDSFLRVWHLNESAEKCTVECLHNERMENKSLVGVQFLDEAGTALAVAAYDHSKLSFYEFSDARKASVGL